MFAVYAEKFSSDDPISGLVLGERPDPVAPDGWTTVTVKAASLNHHDLWSLQGVGLKAEALPMILGCDAAGVDEDGNEVLVHAVISSPDWTGDETLDPKRSLLSERYQGTFAEKVAVPRRNVIAKPEGLSLAEAACLPTAWLTATQCSCRVRAVASPPLSSSWRERRGSGCSRRAAMRTSGRELWRSARTRSSRPANVCRSGSTR